MMMIIIPLHHKGGLEVDVMAGVVLKKQRRKEREAGEDAEWANVLGDVYPHLHSRYSSSKAGIRRHKYHQQLGSISSSAHLAATAAAEAEAPKAKKIIKF